MLTMAQVFIFAFICSYLSSFKFRKILLGLSVMDKPNERSSHSEVTVRGGGLSILLPVVITGIFVSFRDRDLTCFIFLSAVIIIAIISMVDDAKSLSQKLRFTVHISVSLLFLCFVDWTSFANSAGNLKGPLIFLVGGILLLWLVGYSNAFNFMDGINGLASFQAIITFIYAGIAIGCVSGHWENGLVLMCMVIGGGALGFLPHNFPRASMFMGDAGSVTLGFSSAAIGIWSVAIVGWELFVTLCLIHMNFLLDTGITLSRRILKREQWWMPHRQHFYQKLIRSGKSHSFVTLTEMGIQLLLLPLLIRFMFAGIIEQFVIVLLVLIFWVAYFCYAEWCLIQYSKQEGTSRSI